MDSKFIRKNNKKKRRPRKIIFFNPPFCNTVKTKIGKQFFHLVNLHFSKSNRLCKIFNRNTVKLSYSCLPNIKNIINSHNRKILKEKKHPLKTVIVEWRINAHLMAIVWRKAFTRQLYFARKAIKNILVLLEFLLR